MNVIDFIRESAVFLVEDRPDIYDTERAVQDLSEGIDILRDGDAPFGIIMFASYILIRFVEDDLEELFLTRKLSSLIKSEKDDWCEAYTYVGQINLADPLAEDD